MPGVDEILYRTSSDNGATFSSLLTNLSVNAGDSRFPAIAASLEPVNMKFNYSFLFSCLERQGHNAQLVTTHIRFRFNQVL